MTKILAFAGSLRAASLNRRLIAVAAAHAASLGASVELADFHSFDMPPYDGDIEDAEGLPAGAQKLVERIAASDALIISAPEYNNSVAGTLKNAVDWVSRARPVPFKGRSALLLSASPGLVGGNRGLWALRVPLELLGTHVYPTMFSLASADKAFAEDGSLVDAGQQKRLFGLIEEFVDCLEIIQAGRSASESGSVAQ